WPSLPFKIVLRILAAGGQCIPEQAYPATNHGLVQSLPGEAHAWSVIVIDRWRHEILATRRDHVSIHGNQTVARRGRLGLRAGTGSKKRVGDAAVRVPHRAAGRWELRGSDEPALTEQVQAVRQPAVVHRRLGQEIPTQPQVDGQSGEDFPL